MKNNLMQIFIPLIITAAHYSMIDSDSVDMLTFFKKDPVIIRPYVCVQEELLPPIRPEGVEFFDSINASEKIQKCL